MIKTISRQFILFLLFTSFGFSQNPTWNNSTHSYNISVATSEIYAVKMYDANTGIASGYHE